MRERKKERINESQDSISLSPWSLRASLIAGNIGPAFGGAYPTSALFRSHLFVGQNPCPSFEAIGWTVARHFYGKIYEGLNGTGQVGDAVWLPEKITWLLRFPIFATRRLFGAVMLCGYLERRVWMEVSTVKDAYGASLSDGGFIGRSRNLRTLVYTV